jgi:hypothetical protein
MITDVSLRLLYDLSPSDGPPTTRHKPGRRVRR